MYKLLMSNSAPLFREIMSIKTPLVFRGNKWHTVIEIQSNIGLPNSLGINQITGFPLQTEPLQINTHTHTHI